MQLTSVSSSLLLFQVQKTCGTPNLLPSKMDEKAHPLTTHNSVKWAMPPDAEMLHFLSTIEKSKEFYANIVNK